MISVEETSRILGRGGFRVTLQESDGEHQAHRGSGRRHHGEHSDTECSPATMEDYETLNKVYAPYFPNGGSARMTVAVSGIPGRSLLEIDGIAAIVNPPRG